MSDVHVRSSAVIYSGDVFDYNVFDDAASISIGRHLSLIFENPEALFALSHLAFQVGLKMQADRQEVADDE